MKRIGRGMAMVVLTGALGCASEQDTQERAHQQRLGECEDGVVARGLASVAALTGDGQNVYWTESTTGSIYRVARDGGAIDLVTTLPAGAGFYDLHAEEGTLFASFGNYTTLTGAILRIDGSGTTPLYEGTPVRELAVDATDVYFDGNFLGRVARTGGAIETLHAVGAAGVAIDDATIYYRVVAACDTTDFDVLRLAKAGGDPEPFAPCEDQPGNLVADDFYVFFGDENNGNITRVRKDTLEQLIWPSPSTNDLVTDLERVALDYVVWSSRSYADPFAGTSITEADLEGGGQRRIGDGGELAVDADFVYYTQPDGTLNRYSHSCIPGEEPPDGGTPPDPEPDAGCDETTH